MSQFKMLTYWEHYNSTIEESESAELLQALYSYRFKKKKGDLPCYTLEKNDLGHHLSLSYYIGVDWIEVGRTSIYVAPKLNPKLNRYCPNNDPTVLKEINYLQMLFSALRHPEISKEIDELFEIKWDLPEIEIEQKHDLLTPLLVIKYLALLKTIVRKGLKKSYYKVEKNLYGRIKGKVLTSRTITDNVVKNKQLHTFCEYEEFGLNGPENRLLKKALLFVQRYLPAYSHLHVKELTTDLFNYIAPAFATVSEEAIANELRFTKTNVFYKEYEEALRLAKMIVQRFGYNISNTAADKIKTAPFWIDMSKLFELYVLGLFRNRFPGKSEVQFQFHANGNILDYLLNSDDNKMVVDAKYRLRYLWGFHNEDIQQVSGYARLKSIYAELKKSEQEIIDCLIIYPDQDSGEEDFSKVNFTTHKISQFVQVYKVGVRLPVIE